MHAAGGNLEPADTVTSGRVLYFDVTKSRRQGHSSGLNRVSRSLRSALAEMDGLDLRPVRWSVLRRSYVETGTGRPVGGGGQGEAFFTPETFALNERWFCERWLKSFLGRSGVVFHDAIPHYHPETTWPRSVKRFPKWFAGLTRYNHVFFVSEQSRSEARELGPEFGIPELTGSILHLGCDYQSEPPDRIPNEKPVLLQVGIIEPRKGQDVLLEACEQLWKEGLSFQLVLLGRVNPHYGRGILDTIRSLKATGRDLVHEEDADDDRLAYWHARTSFAVQPSRAEGFGLPVLESLWAGCPVVTSRQPCLECLDDIDCIRIVDTLSMDSIVSALRTLINDGEILEALRKSINRNSLPTWRKASAKLSQELGLLSKP